MGGYSFRSGRRCALSRLASGTGGEVVNIAMGRAGADLAEHKATSVVVAAHHLADVNARRQLCELMSAEDQRRIIEFNRKMLTLRQQLRDVRKALNSDIDTLERIDIIDRKSVV